MLVSASAGTGKTTVMIERIAQLIAEGADISELVVVTFTNLAAAQMKNRLAAKLAEKHSSQSFSQLSDQRVGRRMLEQLEKLDTASICTMHSFCGELLRNWFYVVDIDPSFVILDSVTAATLRNNALEETFHEYFKEKDEVFKKVYKIFATRRKEENFKTTLLSLYDFSRCLENFGEWYQQNRQKFVEYSDDNPIVTTILADIKEKLATFEKEMLQFAQESQELGSQIFATNCILNANAAHSVDCSTLSGAFNGLYTLNLETLGIDKKISKENSQSLRDAFNKSLKKVREFAVTYAKLGRGRTMEQIWEDTKQSVVLTDKLVEILERFNQKFFQAKKQRGGVDFADMEHLALQVLSDPEAAAAIHARYKLVFVDEYQDTNPVQEAIISRLSADAKLFMVGDIKQSIYGFRGCDPTIFLKKYQQFKRESLQATADGQACAAYENADNQTSATYTNGLENQNPSGHAAQSEGNLLGGNNSTIRSEVKKCDECQNRVEELNQNFRSNREILQFVNDVFCTVMTEDFGKVDYAATSQLEGGFAPTLNTPSVQIDLVQKQTAEKQEATEIYDITAPSSQPDAVAQGDVIAQKISEFVGTDYVDKKGETHRIGYGDIAVLLRSFKEKAVDIYNALVEHNIPVSANFKTESFANKEVRDVINLLRAVDNPYNDIYTVGACLTQMGGFSENMLAQIKIATDSERVPFYSRMQTYAQVGDDEQIKAKICAFFELLDGLRMYSHSATVDEVVLKILEKTHFHLYVQGFPNGTLRLRKLYSFIDSLKGASFAQSVSKFLYFLDQSDMESEESVSSANAVRLMTMHASKGLEFPVVILADVDHSFNFESPSVQRNADLGLAMKFYDFDQMRVYETLGTCACGMFNRKTQQEEEMRLLYVAMTRAEFVLDIVGTIDEGEKIKQPNRATSHLDWILAALNHKYGDFKHAETSEKITIYCQKPEVSVSKENLICPQYDDEKTVLDKINYLYPFADQTKMPNKIVSSALDREFIDTDSDRADFVLFQNDDRNALGTAYHKVYQYVNYDATREGISATINGLVNEGKIDKDLANKLDVDLIFQTLNNPALRTLMQQGKTYHEMPFMLIAPYNQIAKDQRFCDEVMLQGVIDLLILGENNAIVVDFKFSAHSAELLRKDYRYQLDSYRLAVQKICGVQNVDCYILSIEDNTLIKMDCASDGVKR